MYRRDQVGGMSFPDPEDYPDPAVRAKELKSGVVSVFYFQVADIHVRPELDFTVPEAKSAMYEENEADTLAALAYGKNDGIFTTGLEFGDSFKYFTEPVKLQGSPTSKSKGLLTLIDQVKNWLFVIGAKK